MSLNLSNGMLSQQKRGGGGRRAILLSRHAGRVSNAVRGFFPGLRVFLRGLVACAAVLERCLLADAREG
ncbi:MULTISPECIES: hypothetical protein [Ralstonia solanacearum species complex]|uniref:hypothetical protein n=1 Tax=Ralstonia solanacearum species complex TaxID=3116862 RepID=UPI0013C2E3E8|nr:hypothetical protein [Ralstonia solanacearum]